MLVTVEPPAPEGEGRTSTRTVLVTMTPPDTGVWVLTPSGVTIETLPVEFDVTEGWFKTLTLVLPGFFVPETGLETTATDAEGRVTAGAEPVLGNRGACWVTIGPLTGTAFTMVVVMVGFDATGAF